MRCPFCHFEESKVTDSRSGDDSIRRRRECLQCGKRFTTFETLDLTIEVLKRDGTYEDFQPEKLLKGLEAACRHSKISHDEVRAFVSGIAATLMERQIRQISSQELGNMVMERLQEIDEVAYIRFACVYKRFKRIEDVVGEIQSITPRQEK